MCGIFGVTHAGFKDGPWAAAVESMAHRGPDAHGHHLDDTVFLGHRRLSVIDLESGDQPIYNEDRTKCIVCNGEIYNFHELRKELIGRGHVFTTRSDTETVLHAYEEWGEACVERLRGMFAFAVWDMRARELFLARDRFGIKPLFYARHKGRFYFASEIKAILADPGFPRDMDEGAMVCFFTLSYIPAPLTIFSSIRKLLPGHTLTWKAGEVRTRKYWDLVVSPQRGRPERYFVDGFLTLLEEAVGMHLVSDVPLGAFLSGGIDSSAIVAMMARTSREKVNTFTIGFGGEVGGYLDEREYAAMVASRHGTNHREYEVHPDPEGILEKIVQSFDEPFADDSTIPTYFVCRQARRHVTVALSGLGGDEAMGGYERYVGYLLRGWYTRLPLFFRERLARALVEALPERSDGHYTVNHMKRFIRSASSSPDTAYYGFLTTMNPNIGGSLFTAGRGYDRHRELCRQLILDHFNNPDIEGPPDAMERVFYCDAKTYLPDDILCVTDRLSMHHSLEARVPFLDHRLFEFCARIPVEMKMRWFHKKHLFRKAARPLLPHEVLDHRKQGFVGPMTQWLKRDLRPYTEAVLSEKSLGRHGLLHYPTVRRVLDEHYSGREIHDTLIWSLLVFQAWYGMYIEKSAAPAQAPGAQKVPLSG